MAKATIPIEAVRDKLLTIEQVRERFATTEPLDVLEIELEGKHAPKFRLDDSWNHEIDTKPGLDPVDATIKVGTKELRLTKDALLEATSLIGIRKEYMSRTPASLMQPQVNYWYGNRGGVQGNKMKVLAADGLVYAFTKATIEPFSNLRLLDEVEASAREEFGKKATLYVDYKFQHDLRRTACRVIVPDVVHDVRDGDPWSAGVQFKQSVVGEKPLSLNGYLFRYWCTNGAVTTHAQSGNYNRRKGGQGDEVYEWARASVDEIFTGFEHEFDALDQLAGMELPKLGGANQAEDRARALMDVFETYGVPLEQREAIINTLNESEDFSMYGVMQAITMVANNAGLRDTIRETLMRVGGDLPRANADRCKSCRRLPV
jgi:hypothetical protein